MTSTALPQLTKLPASVSVDRVSIQGTTPALLVRPADHQQRPGTMPGVLWLHWLGHHRGNMRQFLPEAVDLADDGVVSLLPQGHFPWLDGPEGAAGDSDRVVEQLALFSQALSALRDLRGVDAGNTAIVAHDYGAMYALLLEDPRARLVVAAAPDADWATWFLTYWPTRVADPHDYARRFAALSPLQASRSYGPRLFLQWARKDEYVGDGVPDRYAEVAPSARVETYDYDHQLGDAAIVDRLAALRACLLDHVEGTGDPAARR